MRALDFGRPDEAQRTPRRCQPALANQLRKGSRDLENRRAAAGIVVGARARMIEVTAEDDLLAAHLRIGPANRRRGNRIGPRFGAGIDACREPHRLARREARGERTGARRRDHERESLHLRKTVEVSPADERGVLAPPTLTLVLRPADDTGGAVISDGEVGDRTGLRRSQHQASRDLLAGVVALLRPGADVDELGARDFARDAVLCEAERGLVPVRQALHPPARGVELPELGETRIPRRPRTLRAVKDLAVGWQHDRRNLGQTVSRELGKHEPGRGGEARRAAHPVLARETFDRADRRLPGDLRGDRRGLRRGEERRQGQPRSGAG